MKRKAVSPSPSSAAAPSADSVLNTTQSNEIAALSASPPRQQAHNTETADPPSAIEPSHSAQVVKRQTIRTELSQNDLNKEAEPLQDESKSDARDMDDEDPSDEKDPSEPSESPLQPRDEFEAKLNDPEAKLVVIESQSLVAPEVFDQKRLGNRDEVALVIQDSTSLIPDLAKIVADYAQDYSGWTEREVIYLDVDWDWINSMDNRYSDAPVPYLTLREWLPVCESVLIEVCDHYGILHLPSRTWTRLNAPITACSQLIWASDLPGRRQVLLLDSECSVRVFALDNPNPINHFQLTQPNGHDKFSAGIVMSGTIHPSVVILWKQRTVSDSMVLAHYSLDEPLLASSTASLPIIWQHSFTKIRFARLHQRTPNIFSCLVFGYNRTSHTFVFQTSRFALISVTPNSPLNAAQTVASFVAGDEHFVCTNDACIVSVQSGRFVCRLPFDECELGCVINSSPHSLVVAVRRLYLTHRKELSHTFRMQAFEIDLATKTLKPADSLESKHFAVSSLTRIGDDLWTAENANETFGNIQFFRFSRTQRSIHTIPPLQSNTTVQSGLARAVLRNDPLL